MDEPEDEPNAATEHVETQSEKKAHKSLPAPELGKIGNVINALNTQQSKLDAIARATRVGAFAKLSTGVQFMALSDKVSAFTNLGATSRLARIMDEANGHSRHLQEMSGVVRLAAQGGLLTEHSRLAALASGYLGSPLPNWAILQEHSKIGQLMRAQRWADNLSSDSIGSATGRIAHLATASIVSEELRLMADRAAGIRVGSAMGALQVSPGIEAMLAHNARIGETLSKLSVFAGAVDTVGALSATSEAAMGSLLGEWQSRPGLPDEFWRKRNVRQRYYEEAEVDRGLIDARNTEIVEVLIESGVVEGVVSGKSVMAVIDAGPLSVRVSASRTRIGTYRTITSFEIAMRGLVREVLIRDQLEAGENPDAWFKQRVPGDILKRARERKAEAERAGELPADLIAFVDLGDLIAIITFGKNWRAFEPIFGSLEDFRVDMRRLNAIRRPAMHSRAIDPVQFTEMVITIGRLNAMIRNSFGWLPEWNEED